MIKKDLIEKIQELKDEDDINELLKGTDVEETFKVQPTLDTFKAKLTEPEFKSFVDSLKDTHFNTALDTWKSNNLEKLIQAEMLKRNPDKTPEQLQIEELTKKFEEEQSKRSLWTKNPS